MWNVESVRAITAVLVSALLGLGCVSGGGNWTHQAYQQSLFGYAVAYQDPTSKTLIGPDWQLDNYRRVGRDAWTEKTGNDYIATREQDLNQDGTIGFTEKRQEPIFDLRFASRKDNGVIWTKAHPFLPADADQELDVILDNYVDSLSGSGLYAQGNLFGVERTHARNFTTFLVSKQVVRIGKVEALSGTVEIAEVDKLRSNPKHRSGIVRITMVKLRCLTPASCRSMTTAWPLVTCRGKPCRAPSGLLVVGYYNTPSRFEKGLPELNKLLGRISFPNAEPLPVPPVREQKEPAEESSASTRI